MGPADLPSAADHARSEAQAAGDENARLRLRIEALEHNVAGLGIILAATVEQLTAAMVRIRHVEEYLCAGFGATLPRPAEQGEIEEPPLD